MAYRENLWNVPELRQAHKIVSDIEELARESGDDEAIGDLMSALERIASADDKLQGVEL